MSLLDDMPQKYLDYANARVGIFLPNCFTWACARISWIVGYGQPLDHVYDRVDGAQDLWYKHHPNFTQSQTPCKGALMIWQYGTWGHVAVCENDYGTAWSQSNYDGTLYEDIAGSPYGYAGMLFLGYLVHKDLKKAKVVNKSNMEEEDWAVRFKNDTPIIIHKDSSDGPSYGSFTKGETQIYTHKGAVSGHRWIGWTEKLDGKDQFYVAAISGSETRGQDMWVDLIDPATLNEKPKEEKVDYEKNIKHKGIDISSHNGDVDISKYDFVIIRASYGTTEDGWFRANIAKCQKENKPFGVYVYDYALDAYGGIEQAEYVLKLVKGIDIPLGIWFDLEDADGFKAKNNILTREHISHVTKLFCDTVKAAGYYVGVYTTKYWQDTYVNTSYPLWIANWGTNDGTVQGDFSDIAVMHQYSAYAGLDYDSMYVDFDTMKSVVNNETQVEESVEKETTSWKELLLRILQLIIDLLRGDK